MIRFTGLCALAAISIAPNAYAEQVIAEHETKIVIGVVLSDSCGVAAPDFAEYPVKHSSSKGTSIVKFETVQYPKGSWSPDVYLHFPSVESFPGGSSATIGDLLDLSEFPKTEIDGKICYAVLPGAERSAKVLSHPTPDQKYHRVRFVVLVRPPCCPPEAPHKLMNVTGTVIIGPDGFRP